MISASLLCHVSTPCPVVRGIQVDVDISPQMLRLRYTVSGDIPQLRIPPLQPFRRRDELWRHTCLEAFAGCASAPGYHEFNFAPSTEWAAYRFDAYRQGMTPAEPAPLRLSCHRDADRLDLSADISLTGLTGIAGGPELKLALTAVIETLDGQLSYWALAHPSGKPDFHHADGFVLTLPVAAQTRT